MRIASSLVGRQIASSLVLFMALTCIGSAAAQEPVTFPSQQPQIGSSIPDQSKDSDRRAGNLDLDSIRSEEAYPDNPVPARPQVDDQGGRPGTSSSSAQQAQDGTPKPVGTAAAPYEKTTGVAASRPVGAAIAPAKQRRARLILIRVGVIVGGAVAIGTVVALSHGSPSRPN
ncbi:MAG: hypothetical protein ABSE46_07125 [Terracidiphilus sp.]|jgi:hypothetical protein